MKIVDVDKLTPLLESIKKAVYFEDAGSTRNRILSCLSDIDALATDNPWEAAARKLAEVVAWKEVEGAYPECFYVAEAEGRVQSDDPESIIAWAKGETK